MSREERDKKNREFQYSKEQVDELMREMEADPQAEDREIPDEWEQAFRQTIEKAFEEKHRRERKRRNRITALAACAVLVIGVGMNSVMEVQGDSLLEVFQRTFDSDNSKNVTYDTTEDYDMESTEIEESVITFDGETLEEVFSEMRAELKGPLFQCEDIWKESIIETAEYNKTFNLFRIELQTLEGIVYMSQEMFLEESGIGHSVEEVYASVYNKQLECEIPIYRSEQDDFYIFSIQKNQTIFSFSGEGSLENCKKIAENLRYE